jgi:uncharacterized protein YcbX
MHVSALYIHPIKSLLPIPISTTSITPIGLPHDRTFLLRRADPTLPANKRVLHIGHVSQLCLFSVAFDTTASTLTIMHTPSSSALTIPLTPSTSELLSEVEVSMHNSPCTAYLLSPQYSAFFTTHLGFATELLYLGPSTRPVLGNIAPSSSPSSITFADCAPVLLTTTASLSELEKRTGGEVDMRKFRPNVVVSPDTPDEIGAFEEDFWAALELPDVDMEVTANCARCTSINVRIFLLLPRCKRKKIGICAKEEVKVDFETGHYVSAARQPLKYLQKDRRVDPGTKYSPIFGRYAFPAAEGVVSVGDKVEVVRRNERRTEFWWPGLSVGTRK